MDAAHAPSMDVFSLGVVLFIMLVGRKPFNIADSESLAYVHLELAAAPGLRDARCGGAAAGASPSPLILTPLDAHSELSTALGLGNTRCSAAAGTPSLLTRIPFCGSLHAVTCSPQRGGLRMGRWADLSEEAKDLLLRMLEYDPAKRITSKQARHPPLEQPPT